MDFVTSGRKYYKGYQLMLNHLDHNSILNAVNDHTRLKLILIETGAGKLKIDQVEGFYSAPVLLCMNEAEIIAMEDSTRINMQSLFFHPGVINHIFDFNNTRNEQNFKSTEEQDWYLISPFIKRKSGYNGIINISPDCSNRIAGLFNSIKNELENQPAITWPCRSRSFLLELLILVNELLNDNGGEKPGKLDNTITGIMNYLQTHYQEKITVNDLARKFKMNRTTLNQQIVSETSFSVIEYLIRLRIQMASAFLRDTLLNISEIMERVGFSNHTHFWRMFKKEIGLSPSDYRSKYCWMKE